MKSTWVIWVASSLVLLGGCGGACTDDAPPAIRLNLTGDGATAEDLCDAQVIAYDNDGFVSYAEGYAVQTAAAPHSCQFAIAHQRPGNYTIEIKVQRYEAVTLDDIEVAAGRCNVQTVTLNENLLPDNSNCHDGYEWVNDACTTPNGCAFPQLERQVIPGVRGAEITYNCVDSCDALDGVSFDLPEAPGRCPSLALP